MTCWYAFVLTHISPKCNRGWGGGGGSACELCVDAHYRLCPTASFVSRASRLIHIRFIYKFVHSLHHRNGDIEPFSGMCMHPVEHMCVATLFTSSHLHTHARSFTHLLLNETPCSSWSRPFNSLRDPRYMLFTTAHTFHVIYWHS
jgi:sterol desaturase/sphingolipid hydroxylase (fatty acid hydroxylase superfamily)